METTVRDVMSQNVATVPRNMCLGDVERTLLELGVSELFVVDEEGHVIGVLPDYVFLKLRLSEGQLPRDVDGLMTRRFFVIGPDTPLRVAARYLRDYLHHRLAVVENRRLIGLLTRTHVLRHLAAAESRGEAAA